MKVAYLIDREAVGGGGEYIRRKIAALPKGDEGKAFYSVKGECSWRKLAEWGADRIVINHLRAGVQLFKSGRKGAASVTFVVHGIHLRKFDWQPKTLVNRIKRELRRRLESWIYHRSDEVIALTETDAADIRRLYGKDLKVVVEPNTLEGWVAPIMAEDFRGERFDYVCIGRFNFQKGQDLLLKKMKNAASRMNNGRGRVLFIGDGPMLEECRRMVKELDLGDRCVFAGEIPEAEKFLKCAETVVSPSRWEGMPYLMMKARALGCRILATDCPGNRDVLAGYEKWTVLKI